MSLPGASVLSRGPGCVLALEKRFVHYNRRCRSTGFGHVLHGPAMKRGVTGGETTISGLTGVVLYVETS
jgi:hypothetical protein